MEEHGPFIAWINKPTNGFIDVQEIHMLGRLLKETRGVWIEKVLGSRELGEKDKGEIFVANECSKEYFERTGKTVEFFVDKVLLYVRD